MWLEIGDWAVRKWIIVLVVFVALFVGVVLLGSWYGGELNRMSVSQQVNG